MRSASNSRFRKSLQLDVMPRRHLPRQGRHRAEEPDFEQNAEALPQVDLRKEQPMNRRIRFTDIYVKKDGRWQVIGSQGTPIQ